MIDSKIKLGYRERDKLFKKEYSELKIKVVLNWFEIIALLIVSFFVTFKVVSLLKWESLALPIIISILTGILITYIFYRFRKYQLTITRFDKEDIYKKISSDLIDESKKCD